MTMVALVLIGISFTALAAAMFLKVRDKLNRRRLTIERLYWTG